MSTFADRLFRRREPVEHGAESGCCGGHAEHAEHAEHEHAGHEHAGHEHAGGEGHCGKHAERARAGAGAEGGCCGGHGH